MWTMIRMPAFPYMAVGSKGEPQKSKCGGGPGGRGAVETNILGRMKAGGPPVCSLPHLLSFVLLMMLRGQLS